jgi:molecular chaperone DnaK
MVKEAEAHAGEDRKKRDVVEARNQLDSLIYTTEKTVQEHGAILDAGGKGEIETELIAAKKVLETQDAESMRAAAESLSRASHKLAEKIYARASREEQPKTDHDGDARGDTGGNGAAGGKRDDVVDADYEEVKE